jgi:hypothetical protein
MTVTRFRRIVGLLMATGLIAGCGVGPAAPGSATWGVSEADQGKTLTVHPGDSIFVVLHGSATEPWAPLQTSDNRVVAAMPLPFFVVDSNDVRGFYRAGEPGTAMLTAGEYPAFCFAAHSHPPCVQPARAFVIRVVVGAAS